MPNIHPKSLAFIRIFRSFSFLILVFSWGFCSFAQQIDMVDFLKIEANITPDPLHKSIKATADYYFKILKKSDSVFLDAKNMQIEDYEFKNGKIVATKDKIWLINDFEAGKEYRVSISYQATPLQTLYFFGEEIWTQGQGKYTSHWLPSIDDVNDKIEFDLSITAAPDKKVVANGFLKNISETNSMRTWHFDMNAPMSSYLVAFAIGDFDYKKIRSESGVPLYLYYKATDSLKFEPTYRYSKEIFDFLEKEIGVSYPWENYKQLPLRDFLYAGMENTTATFFSEAFMVDSIGFNDRNYVNVNAHELAHQWFGNLVTATKEEDHWLQEGFATYYALQAERHVFGENYYYWQLYESAENLKQMSEEGKGESLLNSKAGSLTFYQKGAWALHILRELIGEESFKISIVNYLKKYKFKTVSTEDFLSEVRSVSEVDISDFERDWLQQSAFQSEEAYQSLMKSGFIESFFEISALRARSLDQKRDILEKELSFPDDFIGQEAVYQLMHEPISESILLYKKAFNSNNLFVRQAIAFTLAEIPKEIRREYASLLQDDSYLTMEVALYNLWTQFPSERVDYLNQTKDVVGFQNKNVRQLWLALAYITPEYEKHKKEEFLNELIGYSSENYSFEIRQKAFEYIGELNLWEKKSLNSLVEACVHPAWRFSKYSRSLLKSLLENSNYISELEKGEGLSPKALDYLDQIIKE